MKALQLFSAGLAFALALVLTAQAQERKQRQSEGPVLLPAGVLGRLDLDAEQKEKIAKLQKEFQEKIEPARRRLEEAIEEARQNQDRRKAQEAQEAFRKEVGSLQQAFGEKLGQVLTDEQRRRVVELTRRGGGGSPFNLPRILGQLDLTDEQKGKVEQLMKELGEKQETAKKNLEEAVEQARQNQDRGKVRELMQTHEREMAKLYQDLQGAVQGVLTEEQKRRFADIQGRRAEGVPPGVGQMLPPRLQERLGLTPEQREKVAKLQNEMETKLKEILNDEQNRKLDELKRGGAPEQPRRRE
jgi:hypothetical protein